MKKIKQIKNALVMLLCVFILPLNVLNADAASKTIKLSEDTFDVAYYYTTYPDLQAAFGYDYDALYNHYLTYGLKEGRYGSAEFNCSIYMNNYSDLRNAFQDDYLSYCLHYEQFGKSEERTATDILATNGYSPATTAAGTTTNTIIGSYSTCYDATIQRAVNVELAASRINGIVLQPGQTFSFSQTILPRTPENGYVEATVIIGGEYSTGYGGGVCQVSSTLYAAMLNANLPATERHPHSLPVSYMPEGMDATISSTVKDLKFENIFDYPIQISATTDSENGVLTVSILK